MTARSGSNTCRKMQSRFECRAITFRPRGVILCHPMPSYVLHIYPNKLVRYRQEAETESVPELVAYNTCTLRSKERETEEAVWSVLATDFTHVQTLKSYAEWLGLAWLPVIRTEPLAGGPPAALCTTYFRISHAPPFLLSLPHTHRLRCFACCPHFLS